MTPSDSVLPLFFFVSGSFFLLATAGRMGALGGPRAAAVCVPPWLAAVALVLLAGAGGVSAIERIAQRRRRRP